jgi:histidine triad (HIT) family protein
MANGEIKPDIVYEDSDILAFRDISPQAPVHILVIPKKHISTLNDIKPEDVELMGKIFLVVQKVANEEGISEKGFRTVFNCNRDAGQEVFHIHLHVLGGRKMTWPPG